MNMALAGLTAREEVALGMLVGKSLPGWQCSTVAPGHEGAFPTADLYVVDLAGRGMARWTEAAQTDLLNALKGAPAVLIASAFDQTWSALDAHCMKNQPLMLLHKPYGAQAMQAALKQAAAGCARPVAPTALPVALSLSPLVQPSDASASGATESSVAVAVAAPAPVSEVKEENEKMALGEFQAHVGAFAASEPRQLMRKLAEALALRHPFEVRVSFLNRMIFHPDAQWMAGNTPALALKRLCQDDTLASGIEIDTIDDKDAMARALRLGMPMEPLDVFLWKLAHGKLDNNA